MRGGGCGVRDAGCGVMGAGCGVWGAAFEVGIGMIYEWACLSVTADCVEAMIREEKPLAARRGVVIIKLERLINFLINSYGFFSVTIAHVPLKLPASTCAVPLKLSFVSQALTIPVPFPKAKLL